MESGFDHRQASAEVFEGIYADALQRPVEDIPRPPAYWSEGLLRWADARPGQSSAEVGCGSGYMSLALDARGLQVTLIDIAPSALEVAKRIFDHHGRPCATRLADLFHMDGSEQYDLVWNAGVMEHFLPDEIRQGLASMGQAVKPGGRMIILVPSAKGLLYRWGKRRLERKGRWAYGVEYPQATLAPFTPPGFRLLAEDQIGVCGQAELGAPAWARKAVVAVTGGNEFHPFWKRLLGGYLLVSVFVKDR